MSDKPFDMITVREHLRAVSETLLKLDEQKIAEVVEILAHCRERGNRVYLFGNGGSAATASHFANDLLKMCHIKAICISDMTPTTLAYGNDEGWENMFVNPGMRFVEGKDIAIGFSCSGGSKNVGYGLMPFAKGCTVLFTGKTGGNCIHYASHAILVPHPDITVQEDVHLAVCHAIANALKV
jgi:D-sedoheptulose 7-phosphate isomerase